MKTFLQTVADYAGQKVKGNWDTTTLIFPNNRSCYYFKEQLKQSLPKGAILPEIVTLEHFSMRYTLIQKADNIDLSLNLFKTYKQFFPEISFQQFLPISQNLLTDFSELESELMDIDLFFRNLQQLKSMNVYMEEDEEKAYRYKYFWQCVEQCYRNLKVSCNEENSGYTGMLYRNAAENIATINLPNRHYFIVGFTQLSAAEAGIIKYILDTQKGEYLADTDTYYINDKLMTAGISYRKNFKRLGIKEPKFIEENITSQAKEINIYPCNGKQEQVQTVYSLIQQLDLPTESHTDTAILLPEPSMLQPLIAQLPERYKNANISLGLSMSNASIYRLLSSLQQCLHYTKVFNDETYLYLKSLIKLIENPLLQTRQSFLGELIKMSEKSVYISIKNVCNRLSTDDKLSLLLTPNNSTSTFGESLYHFILDLASSDDIERNHISLTADFTKNINQKPSITSLLNIDDYLMLLLDQISSTEIPFDVNPKKGLQIMGIRESRNLDFKNVFILSMNEGVFPTSSKGNSYIPIEIRMAYLTPPIEKDAISSYLFYRLLHRSEKLFFLYNQQVKSSGGGELSRFIIQTKITLKHLKNIEIKEWEVKSNWTNPIKPDTIIQKNDTILTQLKQQLSIKGLSPSGLNVFVNCSLQYYYKYVLGLRNKDEAAETIEADLLGSTVHNVIEKLFESHINTVLTKEVIDTMKKGNKIEQLVNDYLEENFDTKLLIGQNYLLAKVAEKLIRMFLNQEADFVSKNTTTIIQQEDELTHYHSINGVDVKFKGFADRIDVVNDILRIVDYKTGKDSSLDVKEDKWEDIFSDPKKAKTLQVLLYAWLYKKSKNTTYPISSGIYWLKKSKDNFDAVKINKEEILTDDILEKVESSLNLVVGEMLDPAIPFCMTEDENRCQYCDFKTICAR